MTRQRKTLNKKQHMQEEKEEVEEAEKIGEHVKNVGGHADAYILNYVNLLNF